MKVNEQTRKLIIKELPLMSRFLDDNVTEFLVKLIDLDTLKISPRGFFDGDPYWGSGQYELYEKILLIDGLGKTVGQVGKKEEDIVENKLTFQWPFFKATLKTVLVSFNETVGQALDRIGENSKGVRYIIKIKIIDRTLDGEIIVYKVSKKYKNLAEHLEQKSKEKAEETLREIKKFVYS
jgi:hypothetical protein